MIRIIISSTLICLSILKGYGQSDQIIGKINYVRTISFSGESKETPFELLIGSNKSLFVEQQEESANEGIEKKFR